ncbi:uncharacterized protein LOC108484891 [Gossypium arboreum]|uniref:uncharacterized protein LOC108484891 n=1 Tax=Gossypium arboreum TaxID=29729 RepID=UPI0008197B2E|nr:uncharacterized protein LOC108484891 [Gossypium arboreum]
MSDLRVMFARLSLFDYGSLLTELSVLNDSDLRQSIMRKVHSSPYAMYLSGNKIYRDLHELLARLPLTPTKKDSVWIIVDRLTKSAHFILVRTDYSLQKLANLYISEIVRLYEALVSIISNRDPHFTS